MSDASTARARRCDACARPVLHAFAGLAELCGGCVLAAVQNNARGDLWASRAERRARRRDRRSEER